MKKALLSISALCVFGLVFALESNRAEALSQPLSTLDAFVLTVADSATKLVPTDAPVTSFKSCRIANNSDTVVYIGGAGVDTTDGYPVCTDTTACLESALTVDGVGLHAIVATGTLDVNVICGR